MKNNCLNQTLQAFISYFGLYFNLNWVFTSGEYPAVRDSSILLPSPFLSQKKRYQDTLEKDPTVNIFPKLGGIPFCATRCLASLRQELETIDSMKIYITHECSMLATCPSQFTRTLCFHDRGLPPGDSKRSFRSKSKRLHGSTACTYTSCSESD